MRKRPLLPLPEGEGIDTHVSRYNRRPPLLAALGGIWWFQKGDLGEYRRFSALSDSHSRQMRFRLWLVRSALAFLLPVLVGLVLLGRIDALAVMPGEFAAIAAIMPPIFDSGEAMQGC